MQLKSKRRVCLQAAGWQQSAEAQEGFSAHQCSTCPCSRVGVFASSHACGSHTAIGGSACIYVICNTGSVAMPCKPAGQSHCLSLLSTEPGTRYNIRLWSRPWISFTNLTLMVHAVAACRNSPRRIYLVHNAMCTVCRVGRIDLQPLCCAQPVCGHPKPRQGPTGMLHRLTYGH